MTNRYTIGWGPDVETSLIIKIVSMQEQLDRIEAQVNALFLIADTPEQKAFEARCDAREKAWKEEQA